jgi:hypothetical protein
VNQDFTVMQGQLHVLNVGIILSQIREIQHVSAKLGSKRSQMGAVNSAQPTKTALVEMLAVAQKDTTNSQIPHANNVQQGNTRMKLVQNHVECAQQGKKATQVVPHALFV